MKAIEHPAVQEFLLMTKHALTPENVMGLRPIEFYNVAEMYARATEKAIWISVVLDCHDAEMEKRLFEAEAKLVKKLPYIAINFRHADVEVMPPRHIKSIIPRGSQLVYSRSRLANSPRILKTGRG